VPRGKIEANAELWSDRVRRWKESGLTAAEFAVQEGLSRPQALSWWAHRLSRSAKARKPAALKLVRVEPVVLESGVATREGGVEIRCGDYRIDVRAGFDETTLRRVLAVMEAGR
jgi:hypothetical protein